MPQMTSEKSAYDIITPSDADVLPGPEAVLKLSYPCPECGQTEGLRAEVIGVQAICWCPDCRDEAMGDNFERYGAHDLLEQFVLEGDFDFSLRDVPAERAEVLEN